MLIDKKLLDGLFAEAGESQRKRMNWDLRTNACNRNREMQQKW